MRASPDKSHIELCTIAQERIVFGFLRDGFKELESEQAPLPPGLDRETIEQRRKQFDMLPIVPRQVAESGEVSVSIPLADARIALAGTRNYLRHRASESFRQASDARLATPLERRRRIANSLRQLIADIDEEANGAAP